MKVRAAVAQILMMGGAHADLDPSFYGMAAGARTESLDEARRAAPPLVRGVSQVVEGGAARRARKR
ncbi:MAG TPA: hypothetical protein VGF59_01510 [Bryobacteraceae bacterium]|jgi:hypothetical protein